MTRMTKDIKYLSSQSVDCGSYKLCLCLSMCASVCPTVTAYISFTMGLILNIKIGLLLT